MPQTYHRLLYRLTLAIVHGNRQAQGKGQLLSLKHMWTELAHARRIDWKPDGSKLVGNFKIRIES